MVRTPRLIGIAALSVVAATTLAITWPTIIRAASAPAAQLHDVTLTEARVSTLEAGQLVVSMQAAGDLRGLVTLKLEVGTDGAITGGDWAVADSYLEDLNADGSVAPLTEEHHEETGEAHREFIRLVNKGTVGGRVTGGYVGEGTGGAVSLVNLQLELTTGSLTFQSITSGTGSLDADLGLTDAQGSLRLSF